MPNKLVTCKRCNADVELGVIRMTHNLKTVFVIGIVCDSCHRMAIESDFYPTPDAAYHALDNDYYLQDEEE